MTRVPPLALALVLAGFSPLEADEPRVAEGNARLEAGDPEGALRSYDEAERAVGSRPEIDHDRGNAAHAAGRTAEATAAWRRAAERAPARLASRALQNLGTALAAEGDREGAARAFADALLRDPTNEDARYDLEVLLRGGRGRPAPQRGAQGAEPSDPAGERSSGDPADADASGPRDPPPEPPAGQRAEREAAEPRPGEDARGAGERQAGEPSQGAARTDDPAGGPGRAPLSRREAEALLDALRAREKKMPLPFGERRRGARRADAAKDW